MSAEIWILTTTLSAGLLALVALISERIFAPRPAVRVYQLPAFKLLDFSSEPVSVPEQDHVCFLREKHRRRPEQDDPGNAKAQAKMGPTR